MRGTVLCPVWSAPLGVKGGKGGLPVPVFGISSPCSSVPTHHTRLYETKHKAPSPRGERAPPKRGGPSTPLSRREKVNSSSSSSGVRYQNYGIRGRRPSLVLRAPACWVLFLGTRKAPAASLPPAVQGPLYGHAPLHSPNAIFPSSLNGDQARGFGC